MQGTVLKRHHPAEEGCYLALMKDMLREVVPTFYRRTMVDGAGKTYLTSVVHMYMNFAFILKSTMERG